ncbi:globin domain-containing protein [Streptomyces sp. NPDC002057]|uniref:globin domain-containing protein n=1 Tax=Streptomyces sp. NPDC002057 TaxID=3154664 RepID=UPI0033194273
MLSEHAVPVVRATLPAVGGALDRITARFYERLFAAHPELLRDLFNRGNQAGGEQRQALAGSIAAFAVALVEKPDVRPDVMLSRIAHKHASLGVTAAQYKTVHEHLFAAIVEVLGDAVTPEVAQAWDEVYWLMANALIALETRLYQEAGITEGQAWRSMEITERRDETSDTTSFVLRRTDGTPTEAFRPGQYVSVRVTLPDGARQIRQYSLSAAPGRPGRRITVKRVDGDPAGEVSSWLHAHARAGDTLEVSAPFGDLVLPEGETPLLLASAGIGSTPMLAMLDHLAATGSTRPVVVVHADRAPGSHAHAAELRELVDALPQGTLHLWYEEPGDSGARPGRADVTALDLPAGVTAYLCGPLPFLRAVRGDLVGRGVAASDIHYEVFGPDLWLGGEN